jgi:WS/DGAT/MGAT family acyltransferase
MADGISAVDIGMLLFDTDPTAEPGREQAPWSAEPLPSGRDMIGRAVTGLFATAGRTGRWLRVALRQPRRAARRAADGIAGLWEVTWNLFKPAPAVPFNREIGSERSFAFVDFDLPEFKAIKNALDGTVNDVCLAVATGALRRWLEAHGAVLDGTELKALVPVSIRAEDEHGVLGNRLTAMRGPLPVGMDDPVARLQAISAAMDGLKSSKQPLGAEAIWGLNDWFRDFAPPLLLGPTAAINFSTRLFNLLLTNFPGPQIPFYVLGRQLTNIYPVGFLARRHGLAIAILSYHGQISFGILADPQQVDDLERLCTDIRASFDELRAAATTAAAAG